MLKRDRQPIGTYARHYYDLFQLAGQEEVIAMLKSAEYAAIKADYDQISSSHFARSYFHPDDMSFAKSDALFPPAELAATIAAEYDEQCKVLCYGGIPRGKKFRLACWICGLFYSNGYSERVPFSNSI